MRNLLAFFAALLLSFVVAGWWLDWYHLRTTTTEGRPSVTVDFNTKKMGADMQKAEAAIAKGIADRAARLEAEKKADDARKLTTDRKAEGGTKFN